MMKRIFAILATLALTGCAVKPLERDLSAFRAASPRSILGVPVVNKSLDVDAPAYLLSSLSVPLAERGYYVFPVNTTKVVLEQEGFYEGEQVHEQPPQALAKMFDADAVLYVTINRWDAQYMVFSTQVTVAFDYRMAAKDGTEIWTASQQLQYAPQQNSGGVAVSQGLAIVQSSGAGLLIVTAPRVAFGGANMVSMTRVPRPSNSSSRRPAPSPGHWLLQDAKARFSELVRRVRSEGPQHVTVHGRDEGVVIAAEDFRRLQGARTGKALIDVLQASPHRAVELVPATSVESPVRDVRL